jgi:hypothetical protein
MPASPRQQYQPSLRSAGNFTGSDSSRVDTTELETANDFVQFMDESEADDAILAAACRSAGKPVRHRSLVYGHESSHQTQLIDHTAPELAAGTSGLDVDTYIVPPASSMFSPQLASTSRPSASHRHAVTPGHTSTVRI